MNRLLRLAAVPAVLVAMLLTSGSLADAAPPAPAHPAKVTASVHHAKVTAPAAPASTSDFTLDVCKFTNPNTAGYVVANWDLDVYTGTPSPVLNTAQPNAPPVVHQDVRVKCRWVPYVTPNFGPLCRIIDRHNNPANIYWGGEGYNWRVVIDYWSCPTNPFP